MHKIDLKKDVLTDYQASAKEPVELTVPPRRYLMADGQGDPNVSADYAAVVEALFTASYTLKFKIKKGPMAIDYGVMPLEGLWWADDMSAFTIKRKNEWKWTMMIAQPEFADDALVAQAIEEAIAKKGLDALRRLRLEILDEGHCAQILHIGPFSEEGRTIERLHQFIESRGRLHGKHHEIYLSDIRRAAPQKWRTILRQGIA